MGAILSLILVGLLTGSLQFSSFIEVAGESKSKFSNLNFKENPVTWDGEVVTIYVLVVVDEEYRRYMDLFGRGWRAEAVNTIEQVDDAFYRDFGINFVVTDFIEWDSDNQERDGRRLLIDAQKKRGWSSGNGPQDIMVIFTGQRIDSFAGWAEHYMGAPEADAVIVQHQFDFGRGSKDWHVLQEEIAHLFGAPDHMSPDDPLYRKEDIMSYKWLYSTDKWDISCMELIERNKHRFAQAG